MTQKKRVYDLAKEYGIPPQDLAAKLRDLGFTQIKGHMTALDDEDVLMIQARLEAYGIIGESAGQSGSGAAGGLVVKKKKRAKAPEAESPVERAPEPPAPAEPAPPQPVEAAHPLPSAPAPAPTRREPPPELAPEPEREDVPPLPEEAELTVAAPEPEEPLPLEAPAELVEPALAESAAQGAAAELVEAEPSAPAPTEDDAARARADAGIVRPAARRKPGNIVGFIDISKLQPPKKAEHRRLKTSEDAAPEVMPTLSKNKTRGITRADAAARGRLTQQQLRERENARFLRAKRPPTAGGPGSAGQRRPMVRGGDGSGGSPYAGSSVALAAPITVKKLADALSLRAPDVLKACIKLLGFGVVNNINTLVDDDTAVLLAGEFQVDLQVTHEIEAEEQLITDLAKKRSEVEEKELVTRAPVIAFLGHVDHGKTTLIDTIRKSKIAEGESGGITQHIGAYRVVTQKGHALTILDTPGHAAFTAMRARGAKAVDIAVLVVAADDGVMPQTEEAINHVRAARVPIVVAINKIDRREANPDKVKNQLSALELIPEEWGGNVAMMPVSGLEGTGVEDLLERVFLESEVLELKCHPTGSARGVVLEAKVEQGKGRVAHLLVQDGGLKRGDIILAGEGYGKVRAITGDRGEELEEAGPSTPVEVSGLNELPGVGDHFHVVAVLEQAKEVAEERARKIRQLGLAERRSVSTENLLQAVAAQDRKVVGVIVKADVAGSLEVLRQQIAALGHAEIELKLIDSGVGQVSESDVDLAVTSNATVFAFRVGTAGKARLAAERGGIEIRNHDVLYEVLDEIRALMEGVLAPEIKEVVQGHTEIRAIFKSSKLGNIAGCYVLDGTVGRDNKCRLLRDGKVVFTGEIASLRREKDDAREVREGFECGITLKNYDDIQLGDVIEGYKLIESRRKLGA